MGTTTMDDLKKMTVRLAVGVLFQELDGEAVLLNARSGQYFGLNELGARIWKGLAAGDPMGGVLSAITSEYQVSEDRLIGDVSRFMATLEKAGLVEVEHAGR